MCKRRDRSTEHVVNCSKKNPLVGKSSKCPKSREPDNPVAKTVRSQTKETTSSSEPAKNLRRRNTTPGIGRNSSGVPKNWTYVAKVRPTGSLPEHRAPNNCTPNVRPMKPSMKSSAAPNTDISATNNNIRNGVPNLPGKSGNSSSPSPKNHRVRYNRILPNTRCMNVDPESPLK